MAESNGIVRQPEFYQEMKLVREDIHKLDNGMTKIAGSISSVENKLDSFMAEERAWIATREAQIEKESEREGKWKAQMEIRVHALESKDKDKDRRKDIIVAAFGAGGVVVGLLANFIFEYIISLLV